MIDDLKPYPAYKDSGVPWLGKVPEHWELTRLKHICARSALYGANIPVEKYSLNGVRFLRTTDITDDGQLRKGGVFVSEAMVRNYFLKTGDILISRSGTIGRAFLFNENKHGRCAYAGYLVRFVPGRSVIPSFLFRFTQTQSFAGFLSVMAISSTIENVNGEKYANCQVPLPPLPEQTAIVRFLDYMDRRMRRYIRAKQKLIKLLEEYKQALIHQAVTGQIDVRTGQPYPVYKPSGVEWLGEVPEHWEVLRLKYVARLRSGESITSERIEETGDYPVYGGNGIRGFTSSFTHEGEFVLIGRQGALCGNINYANGKFWASEHAVVVHPMRKCLNHLLGELLQAMNLNQYSIAAAQPGLAVERIQNLVIPFPPIDEQEQIDQYIKNQVNAFDAAIAATRREIELLREYRARLIADVVTGKVDVREVAARLPEELSEEEAESMDADDIAEDEATDEEAGTETVEEEEVEP